MSVLFFKRFLKRPLQIASIVPSSQALVERVASKIDFDRARVIAEYGPGEGVHSRALAQRMRPDARLGAEMSVIELNGDVSADVPAWGIDELELTLALCGCGVAFISCIPAVNASIQLGVEDHMRGRALALYFVALSGGFPLGALLQSWMAEAIGVRQTLALAGAALTLVGVFYVLRPKLTETLDQSMGASEETVAPEPTGPKPSSLRSSA